jgi:hypothetical protein
LRFYGTDNPAWASFSGNNLVLNPPNGTSGFHDVYIEAFDGAMVSSPFHITVNVLDYAYYNENLVN